MVVIEEKLQNRTKKEKGNAMRATRNIMWPVEPGMVVRYAVQGNPGERPASRKLGRYKLCCHCSSVAGEYCEKL